MVNAWKIILATVIIFGAGVVTGGLLVSHASHAKVKQPRALTSANPPAHWTPPLREFPRRAENELQLSFEQRRIEFLLNATRELKLSPEQHKRIERLVRESQEQTRKLWEQVGPQMRKELVEVKEKIREELTPLQRKRFEELMKRQQVRRTEEAAAPRAPRDARRVNPPRDPLPPGAAPQPVPPPAAEPAPPANP
jgi:hypothetical protein